MDIFKRLKEVYKDYKTGIESYNGEDSFVISNPFWNENIYIVSDSNGFILFFSFYHNHFDYGNNVEENIESVIEYIDSFLSGEYLIMGFFQGNTQICGGSVRANSVDVSSGENLLKSFTIGFDSLYKVLSAQLKDSCCRCLIQGWNNTNNKELNIIV